MNAAVEKTMENQVTKRSEGRKEKQKTEEMGGSIYAKIRRTD